MLKNLVKSFLYAVYDVRLQKRLAAGPFPKHLGVILDGNRRHAKALGLSAGDGHRLGAKKVRSLLTWCGEFKIPVVTLWVFSTQNFSRDPEEVKTLMQLFIDQANAMKTDDEFIKNDIRVRVLGRRDDLPDDVKVALKDLEETTAHRKGMLVQLALAYGGREEIVDACKNYILESHKQGISMPTAAEQITEEALSKQMYNGEVADPDFIIRTSGEVRLSGFLLWQSAFSEYYFLDVNWPGFRRVDFLRALRSFQTRQRRFGR
ncbi:MAG TPA: polyprenyl diphosphate synthase [bacterium]|nr:polyprenyl diphosphate synthase [bacterium]